MVSMGQGVGVAILASCSWTITLALFLGVRMIKVFYIGRKLREHHEMLRQCAGNSIQRDTPVQGDKTPALLDGERQQIGIGYMPGT